MSASAKPTATATKPPTVTIIRRLPKKTPAPKIRVASFKRLARRGGVRRCTAAFYQAAEKQLTDTLTRLLTQAVIVTEYRGRTTITTESVRQAGSNLGVKVYRSTTEQG